MGLGIAAAAGVAYVMGWEAYLAMTDYAFMDEYIAGIVRAREAKGLSAAAMAEEMAKLESLRVNYANPLFRIPMTFLEIFPVGLLVALVSALLLRNPKLLPRRANRDWRHSRRTRSTRSPLPAAERRPAQRSLPRA